ncbi:hypothetical protein HYALB_00006802 [Hymenoscyphus albidus]|uniref:Uncharacterized protein n=1 Tax=Hymenoscyphus albidus TaxID=595503 RepID=A0A9N9LM28_9HELO|nr:hypothetical protein HYALB_00006802 [Hymenoscyphus albidus]
MGAAEHPKRSEEKDGDDASSLDTEPKPEPEPEPQPELQGKARQGNMSLEAGDKWLALSGFREKRTHTMVCWSSSERTVPADLNCLVFYLSYPAKSATPSS